MPTHPVDQKLVALAHRYRHRAMSLGAAIAVGSVLGLAVGIGISLSTDVPLAPEAGLVIGALAGWLWRRDQP